ncbi:NACHT domain-containing protein [Oscillatoria acuminata]|uniref:Putative NTPase (NACHT family) n=1 Tax=Oscillatoria acuminata PCC 6304 TaxID=56110 RepID=K9TLE9_9CYAN|nr:NACHT domain-containing protein [Oscillatoria acuminata]AFY83692.1 putative NTPase (NACHT family) [Oscillatoria acuminata PCC 6304]
MQPLPRDFLTKVAQDYNLTDELDKVFVECFRDNDLKVDYIADILNLSRSTLQYQLGKIYDLFSREVNFSPKGPVKRVQLHQFLLGQYRMEQSEKSQGFTISAPPDTGKDIDTLVEEVREMVRADIQDRCDTMRVLDMADPIGLDDIYTHVNILETITGRRRKRINELLQHCNAEDFERFALGKIIEARVPGLEAIAKYSKLIILGKPGAGKTTFLKHLAIQCLNRKFLGNRIPIFITLKDFAEAANHPSLLQYIAQSHNCVSLSEIIHQGQALVLLDGLDEVREEDSHRILNQIRDFSTDFRDNHFVLTCRIAALEYTFEKFTEVEIADFDPTQISNFANKWFKNKAVKPETFFNQIENNPRIQELATSPLLLTLLCLTFEETGDFPANRSELYKEGLDVLLKKWDAKRGIYRDQVYKKLSPQRKEDLLSKIAVTTFESGDYFFKQKEAERYITDYIRNLPNANTDEEALQLDSEAVLRSIEAQHGLLIERAKGIYSFSHLTFHEYFTAREIIINQQSSEEALQKLVSHLTDRQWREVFLLAVGMSSLADSLLLLMKHEADHLINGCESLEKLLEWVNNPPILGYKWDSWNRLHLIRSFYTCGENLPKRETFLRNLSNEILLLCLDANIILIQFSDTLSRESLKIGLKFVQKLSVLQIFEDSKYWPNCIEKGDVLDLWKSWAKEMKLNNSMLEIIEVINVEKYINSREEAQLLRWYYDVNQLLLDCLNSDCYVSREVREEIEETLLLPIAEIEKRKREKQKRQSQ